MVHHANDGTEGRAKLSAAGKKDAAVITPRWKQRRGQAFRSDKAKLINVVNEMKQNEVIYD